MKLNGVSQVVILGDVFRFDWLETQKLSVAWRLFGCGDFVLQTTANHLDRAVDVYMDKWVRIRLLLYLGIDRR